MLFLVISSPRPERPTQVASSRQAFWRWMEPKLNSKKALFAHPKVGRGLVTAFDVRSHEELHALLNEWADRVPASFELYPLIDPAAAKGFLKKQGTR